MMSYRSRPRSARAMRNGLRITSSTTLTSNTVVAKLNMGFWCLLLCLAGAVLCAPSAQAAVSTPANPGQYIADIAHDALGDGACSQSSAGVTGFYGSCSGEQFGPGTGEYWCADFAKWVWASAGASLNQLNAAVPSFAAYGTMQSTPQVGDAVVFNGPGQSDAHVAIVVAVNGSGSGTTIDSVGGDEWPAGGSATGETWIENSSVIEDNGYSAAPGTTVASLGDLTIVGYIAPSFISGQPATGTLPGTYGTVPTSRTVPKFPSSARPQVHRSLETGVPPISGTRSCRGDMCPTATSTPEATAR
jgi:CHAP domain